MLFPPLVVGLEVDPGNEYGAVAEVDHAAVREGLAWPGVSADVHSAGHAVLAVCLSADRWAGGCGGFHRHDYRRGTTNTATHFATFREIVSETYPLPIRDTPKRVASIGCSSAHM